MNNRFAACTSKVPIVMTSVNEEKKENPTMIKVSEPLLNIRENPDLNSKVLLIVEKDTELQVSNSETLSDEWVLVTTSMGVSGYVMSQFVSKV